MLLWNIQISSFVHDATPLSDIEQYYNLPIEFLVSLISRCLNMTNNNNNSLQKLSKTVGSMHVNWPSTI